MWTFAQAGNNPNGPNFLEWAAQVGGAPLVILVLLAIVGQISFIWWFTTWHKLVSAAAYPNVRTDWIRGIIAGFGFGIALLLLHFVLARQLQAPIWNRQAWEGRGFMMGMFLLGGATVGSTIFQIRRFRRTLRKPGGRQEHLPSG
jgi:hypothetical protein